ncbi:RNA-directed DNA polymerase, eukaryota, reverse transcriptase zinc-binding domain protein [Tanacetum coccineum]
MVGGDFISMENALCCLVGAFIQFMAPSRWRGILNDSICKQSSGTWSQISKLKGDLNNVGINLPMLFKKKLGNRRNTSFWHDNWLGGSSLRDTFPRLYGLETMKNCLVFERAPTAARTIQRTLRSQEENVELCELQDLLFNLNLSMEQDAWEFTPDLLRCFSVKSMRKTISNTLNNTTIQSTKWNKLLPSKVNIMSWRVCNQRLPTRANLNKHGIDLDSVLCLICNSDIATESHVFVTCSIARNIWKAIYAWWHLSDTPTTILEDLVSLSDRVPLENKFKPFFDMVVNNTIWSLWKYRNKVLFNLKRPQKELILNEIKTMSYTPCSLFIDSDNDSDAREALNELYEYGNAGTLGANENYNSPVLVLERGLLNYEGDPVLVGCVKDFKTLPNIHIVCSSEGFTRLKINYLGGFWVLLEFDSFQSCEKFYTHEGIKSWFSTLSQWTPNFEIQDRVVWIDIEGTPLRAWSQSTFNKIAMILEGKVSIIRAKEVTGWVPEFGDETSSHSGDGRDNNSVGKHEWVEEEDDNEVVQDSFQSHVNVTTREEYSNVKPSNEARPLDNLPEQVITPSGDPFGIEDLILKTSQIHKKDAPVTGNSEPKFPPGFTPLNSNHKVNETVPEQVIHDHSSVQRSKEASNNVVDDGITNFELNNKSYCGSKLDHTDYMAH